MGQFSRSAIDFVHALVARAKAPEQGGLFSHENPTKFNASDPIRLWVIQVFIITTMTQLLSLGLSRIRQPRVIAEVIGGVILGPTVMGRIPNFRARIFPDAGMPMLNLTSTIGLVLFLFLVGLEIDPRVMKRNAKASGIISVAGLLVPLGLGAALGVPIYHEFINPSVNLGYFLLFTAVAIGITAFPVLCRILTELKLLDTTVGVVTLAAGVGNDVVGWILLALTVALVNASSGLTALWVLLTSAGYVGLLLFPGKWAFRWLAVRTGSLENGTPTPFMMTVTLLVVFASAFFTDVIGVHAIFGGFLAGLIIPHDNGFAISLVEKLEDLVSLLLLPIYFTLSGLKTNLGLLDNGKAWGYTILICVIAFFSKFLSTGGAAKAFGFNWREAGAIGSLMSCKGLVELIVLNVGLQAGILDTRTFSMFVVHALILTFMTTPLTLLFYPEKYRTHTGPKIHQNKKKNQSCEEGVATGTVTTGHDEMKWRFSMVLDKIEQLPAAMTMMQLLQPNVDGLSKVSSRSLVSEKATESELPVLTRDAPSASPAEPRVQVDALRLIELTARTSAVLKSQESHHLLHSDPVVSVFKTFGYLNRLVVSAALSVVSYDEFSTVIGDHARENDSQMVLVPWGRGNSGESDDIEDKEIMTSSASPTLTSTNPFDAIFGKSSVPRDQTGSIVYSDFIRKVFASSPADVGLFVDRGVSSYSSGGAVERHLFLPFFGGPDDRLALNFVVQLCGAECVSATVVRMGKTEEMTPSSTLDEKAPAHHFQQTVVAENTVYGTHTTETRLASNTADNLLWDRYAQFKQSQTQPNVVRALSRIDFDFVSSAKPLHKLVDLVTDSLTSQQKLGRSLTVVLGRSRRLAVDSHAGELRALGAERGISSVGEVMRTFGEVGAGLVVGGVGASLLVVQSHVA